MHEDRNRKARLNNSGDSDIGKVFFEELHHFIQILWLDEPIAVTRTLDQNIFRGHTGLVQSRGKRLAVAKGHERIIVTVNDQKRLDNQCQPNTVWLDDLP